MNILITGGAGYIGSTLIEELFKHYPSVKICVYDNLMYRQTSLLPFCHRKDFEFVYGDVRDTDKLNEFCEEANVIFPLAAIVGAPACDKDKSLSKQVNCDHVCSIMKIKRKDQLVVYPNSNSGYGVGNDNNFCTEETPLNPISWYGKTKCEAEDAVLVGGGISLRLATVFGASYRMRLDLLVNDFVYRALNDGFLALFEKHFKRNYIHIRDVAKAFMHMMDKGVQGQAYNVGLSSANLSKEELAYKIKEYIPNLAILSDEFKQDVDKRNYIVDNSKLEKSGWSPSYSIDNGIRELIKSYQMLFASKQIHTNL